jgi:hypothetical protein
MADQKDLDILQKINNELAKQVEFETKIARIRGEEVTDLDKQLDRLVKQKEVQANIEEILTETNREVRMAAIDLMEEEAKRLKQKNQITATAYKNQMDLAEELRKVTNDASNEAFKDLQKRLKEQDKLNKALEKQTKAMIAGRKAGAGMASGMAKFVGIAGEADTVVGQLAGSINIFGKDMKSILGGLGGVASGFAKEFKKNFNFTNTFAFLINNQIEVGLAFHQMRTELSKATGAGFEYSHSIEDAQKRSAQLGITLNTATQSTAALYDEFERFTALSRDRRTDVVVLTSKLQEVGISGSTSARALNFMVSELNHSLPEAMAQMREFAEVGVQMGIPPRELAETYVQLMPQLSIFGQRSKQVFDDAAIFSKKLGLSVGETANDIIGLSDRLGTFEGAAKGVAAINIALGGSFINAFDLAMKKSEGVVPQLYYLRDAIQASGKTLDDLGVRTKEYLEDELGTRFGKLQALLQGEEIDEATIKTEAVTLEDQVGRNTTAMQKLQAATEADTTALAKTEKAFSEGTSKMAELVRAIGGLKTVLLIASTISGLGSLAGGIASFRGSRGLQGFLDGAIQRQSATGRNALARVNLFPANKGVVPGKGPIPGGGTGMGAPAAKAAVAALGAGASNKAIEAAAEEVVEGTLEKAGETVAKKAAQEGAEMAGKSLLKKIPLIGAGMGLFFGAQRALMGDFTGAALEIASGAASTVPGLGTAASVAIDSALIAKDLGAFDSATPTKASVPKSAPRVSKPQVSTRVATENAMLRKEMSMLRKAVQDSNRSGQPVKVDLYLDRSGTKKIAEASLDVLDTRYLSKGRVSNA